MTEGQKAAALIFGGLAGLWWLRPRSRVAVVVVCPACVQPQPCGCPPGT